MTVHYFTLILFSFSVGGGIIINYINYYACTCARKRMIHEAIIHGILYKATVHYVQVHCMCCCCMLTMCGWDGVFVIHYLDMGVSKQ